MRVVVQFLLDVLCRPVGPCGDGNGEDVVEARTLAALDLLLHGLHVHLVIMRGMQRGGGGRRHPRRVRTRLRMGELDRQHDRHVVRDRPHALADLRVARQSTEQSGVDVPVLIGLDPRRLLHVALADHGSGFHGAVDLVAGAVEEACVDEHDPVLCLADAFLEVDRRAALLVHDADLHGERGQAQCLLDAGEERDGEGHLVGPMHLRLHDIHGARAGVHAAALGADVVDGDQRRHHRIQNAFRHLAALRIEDCRIGHQVSDVPHQHERAAVKGQRAAVGGLIAAIGVQAAGECLAALLDLLRQVAPHQPEPVSVDGDLVGSVDGSDRVLAVHDGGDGGFDDDIGDARLVILADEVRAVDDDLGMQAVVAQQHGGWLVLGSAPALELRRVLEPALVGDECRAIDGDARDICPFARSQRHGAVEEVPRPGDDARAAHRVVAPGLLRPVLFGNGIGAVECVIERAPARIGGVQRIAGVHHRNHQLGSRHLRNLGVHIGRGHSEVGSLGHQIADLRQEGLVDGHVGGGAIGPVPCVELRLQLVAAGQKRTVLRRQVAQDRGKGLPEVEFGDAGARQCLLAHESKQITCNPQARDLDPVRHVSSPPFGQFGGQLLTHHRFVSQSMWG